MASLVRSGSSYLIDDDGTPLLPAPSTGGASPAGSPASGNRAKELPKFDVAEYLESREMIRVGGCYSLIVDGFRRTGEVVKQLAETEEGRQRGISPRPCFVLSHFHSDHYTGLGPAWRHGPIFCTQSTATLLINELRVTSSVVKALPLNTMHRLDLISGDAAAMVEETQQPPTFPNPRKPSDPDHVVGLAFVDANHCPGAVLAVVYTHKGIMLHTGDFRFNGSSSGSGYPRSSHILQPKAKGARPAAKRAGGSARSVLGHVRSTAASPQQRRQQGVGVPISALPIPSGGPDGTGPARGPPLLRDVRMGDNELLSTVRGKVTKLFLDNTFCDSKHNFPPQEESYRQACQHIDDAIREAASQAAGMDVAVGPDGAEFQPEDAATSTLGVGNSFSSATLPVGGVSSTSSGLSPVRSSTARDAGPAGSIPQPMRVLVAVGSYTIGKERIALALRNRYFDHSDVASSPPIAVTADKLRLLMACQMESAAFVVPLSTMTPYDPTSPATNPPSGVSIVQLKFERVRCPLICSTVGRPVELCIALVSTGLLSYTGMQSALGLESSARRNRNNNGTDKGRTGAGGGRGRQGQTDGVTLNTSNPEEELAAVSANNGTGSSAGVTTESGDADVAVAADDADPLPPVAAVSGGPVLLELWAQQFVDLTHIQRVVALEGTGWVAGRTESALKPKYFLGRKVMLSSVPYSEHCSFTELVQFVSYLAPQQVIPTVSNEWFAKCEHTFVEHCKSLRSKYSNVQPLNRFFSPGKAPQRASTPRVTGSGIGASPGGAVPGPSGTVSGTGTGRKRGREDKEVPRRGALSTVGGHEVMLIDSDSDDGKKKEARGDVIVYEIPSQ